MTVYDRPGYKLRNVMSEIRTYTVRICDDCVNLRGDMCHEAACVFCRRTMREVGEYLDVLLIRPLVNGQRLVAQTPEHEWVFYMNGTFCQRCGTRIGSGYECR